MTTDQSAYGTATSPRGERPAPDALDSLGRWALRPGVSVTVLHNGVHLRGWINSLTLEGGPGLPLLWDHLARALAPDGNAAPVPAAPAGSPLRAALLTVVGQLHDHDLLVERPAGGRADGAAQWLGALADRPAAAAAALARGRARVLAAPADSPLARTAAQALDRAGIRAQVVETAQLPHGQVLLVASGYREPPAAAQERGPAEMAVALGVRAGIGFVTPVGSTDQARADADALASRLRRREVPGAAGHPALPALLASSAAQRLVCAVAGLRDPSAEAGDARLLPGLPMALIAEQEPLRGEYRSWPGPVLIDTDRALRPAAVLTLAESLARVAVLTDSRTGVLEEPVPGALPQLPAALVHCPAEEGTLVSGSARADLARLEAVCRAAELRLGNGERGLVVGAGTEHARGRALRRAVTGQGPGAAGRTGRENTPPSSRSEAAAAPGADHPVTVPWSPAAARHPQAAHWWSVLVHRLGVEATVTVSRLGSGGRPVFLARVHGRTTAEPASGPLGTAVEATAEDAVAFAALSAVVGAQSATAAAHAHHLVTPSGASAALARTGEQAPWEDTGWTSAWLTELAGREPYLQDVLTGLIGHSPQPWEPPATAPAGIHALWSALRQCGFSVLSTRPGHATHPATSSEGLR
ncbi:hypothetical protein [Streptomyces sp. NPDC020330]|uniref:hypothetical protein n=1 Tax=unclassified Streptomyces TaxID=2593676 RepID=UPI0037A35AC7